ncbi:BpFREP18.4 [Biomphalaria pfeifferi]|uniref:BpFREP18.4 n=1 Tax=Biomphalaria pfeifferi TaxID=112525 RepID=A0AAD8C4F6_BIOPF|nr:BpFREP18.4 [Biomphalaria pfeifferi]
MAHMVHLILCVVLVSLSNSELIIDVRPDIISGEITAQLVINCSITNNQVQHLDVIRSLTLSRYDQTIRDFIALITLDSSTLNLKQLTKFSSSQVSFGNLYLALTLHYPTQFDAKVYRCSVNGNNANRTDISLSAKKGVEYETNSTALIEEIRRLKKEEDTYKCSFKKTDRLGSRVHFFASSEIIKERIEPLTLNCSFQVLKEDENETATLQALYILHEINGVIATINKGQSVLTTIHGGHSNSRNAKGEIFDNELKDSYLQVTLSNLHFSESGKYFCEAHTKRSDRGVERLNKMLTISVLSPTFEDLVKVIEKVLRKSDEDNESIHENKQTLKNMQEDSDAKEKNLKSIEEELNTKQRNIISLKEDFNAFQQTMNLFREKLEVISANVSKIERETTEDKLIPSCREVKTREERVVVTLASGLKVMCDTKTDGGGWIIFQRRIYGIVDFYRSWQEYRDGFGDINIGEFYLGNEHIYNLTSAAKYDLRIDIKYNRNSYFAQYSDFQILSEKDKYKLKIGAYSGNAGDNLSYHNNMSFSTYDKDNDLYGSNCATTYLSAWWYNSCHNSNLNGQWGSKAHSNGVIWNSLTNSESASFTEMKIREK